VPAWRRARFWSGKREIARVPGISRVALRKVLRSNSTPHTREEATAESRALPATDLGAFRQLRKGNLARVHEELVAAGAGLSYPALTAFCRRHGIGYQPPAPASQYDFAPGGEMQHDTSPHEAELAGRRRMVQTPRPCCVTRGCCFFRTTRRARELCDKVNSTYRPTRRPGRNHSVVSLIAGCTLIRPRNPQHRKSSRDVISPHGHHQYSQTPNLC
jgi:hypothetical protein